MSDLFFRRLAERLDPRGSAEQHFYRAAQRNCGRWLAIQRLRAGLSAEQASEQSGVPHDIVNLLEAGLAKERDACGHCWHELAGLLAAGSEDTTDVDDAMALILADEPGSWHVLERVETDLRALAQLIEDERAVG